MNIENFSTLKEYQKPQTVPIAPFQNAKNSETIVPKKTDCLPYIKD